MNTLNFTFECLDGYYTITIFFDDETLRYVIDTNIEGFEIKSGSYDDKLTKKFKELIEKAHIDKWDKEYMGDGIEDACKWSVELTIDNKKYGSCGLESYEPYNYEYLIKALGIIENNYEYFLVNI